MNRKSLTAGIVLVAGVLALWAAFAFSPRVAAQSDGERWTSSAEPPAGMSPQLLPPADGPLVPQNDALAPEALISWRVTGSALKPRENDVSYTVDTNGSCTYVTAGDNFTVWNIPVILPQGTVVDTLRMYYYDTSGSNSSAWFTIYDLYGDIVEEWSVSTTGNAGYSFNDSAQINHTVDYSVYSYVLNWRPYVTGATLQLCGFRVFHEPPFLGFTFLPAVQESP